MTPGNWITIGVFVLTFVAHAVMSWSRDKTKTAILETRLDRIETNDIRHLRDDTKEIFARLDEYVEQLAALTTRNEAIVERLERIERRLNGER